MKNIVITLIALILSSCAIFKKQELTANRMPSSDRGKRIGNGGGACVCRDNDKNVNYAQILDFSEAESKHRLFIKNDDREVDVQVNEALDKLKFHKFLYSEIKKEIVKQNSITSFVEKNETLTNDFESRVCELDEKFKDKNCKYEQLAVYSDTSNTLKFSKEILSKLDNLNVAGIKLHEAIYKVDRKYKKNEFQNSEFSKELVANLFSTAFDQVKVLKIINEHYKDINNSFNGLEYKKNNGHFEIGFNDNGKFAQTIGDVFSDIYFSKENYLIVKSNNLYGLINKFSGAYLSARFKAKPIEKADGVFEIIEGSYSSFIDENGEVISDFESHPNDNENIDFNQFKFVGHFTKSGLAFASVDGYNFGFINSKGYFVIQPKYKIVHDFYEGLAAVGDDEFNLKFIKTNGEPITDSSFEVLRDFNNGYAIVNYKGIKFPFKLNLNGQISPMNNNNLNELFGVIRTRNPNHPAEISICRGNGDFCKTFSVKYSEIATWKNTQNSENVFLTQINSPGEYCPIIIRKENLLKANFYVFNFYGKLVEEIFKSEDMNNLNSFERGDCKNGFFRILENNNLKFLDGFGNKFDKIREFSNGFAGVKVKGKWGFINREGIMIIEPIFDRIISDFDSQGFAKVLVLAHDEKFVSDLVWPGMKASDRIFYDKVGGKIAIINKNGVIVKYEN